jgi:Domain of unknown function (DUF1772)
MSPGELLAFSAVVVPGFTACAEFGSYAFVHPVIKRLEVAAHIQVERGLVRTFGRVMPVLMTLSLVLLISWAAQASSVPAGLRVVAVGAWALGLVTTILVNVRINLQTAGWTPEDSPERWRAMRQRWELFQGIRSWAFLISFVTVAAAITGGLDG